MRGYTLLQFVTYFLQFKLQAELYRCITTLRFVIFCVCVFLLVTFSGRTAEKLFSQRFMISYQESVRPRSDSFLGHTKMSFHKYCSTSCYSRCVWHMTQLMHGNQHLKYPIKAQETARNSEHVSQSVDDRRFKGQNREIELISKKV